MQVLRLSKTRVVPVCGLVINCVMDSPCYSFSEQRTFFELRLKLKRDPIDISDRVQRKQFIAALCPTLFFQNIMEFGTVSVAFS